MRGRFSTLCGRRPRPEEAEPDETPGRLSLFLCVCCQAQVLICSCCDRGQIYCAGGCAQEARHHAERAAAVARPMRCGPAAGAPGKRT
jgi:hypothetical protein